MEGLAQLVYREFLYAQQHQRIGTLGHIAVAAPSSGAFLRLYSHSGHRDSTASARFIMGMSKVHQQGIAAW